jgi:hypothetical protein
MAAVGGPRERGTPVPPADDIAPTPLGRPQQLCLQPTPGRPSPPKIREFTIYPELTRPYGLEPCGSIRDLGRIVILVGANGAGKSRYLRLIQDMLVSAPWASEEHTAVADDLRRLEGDLRLPLSLAGAGSHPA